MKQGDIQKEWARLREGDKREEGYEERMYVIRARSSLMVIGKEVEGTSSVGKMQKLEERVSLMGRDIVERLEAGGLEEYRGELERMVKQLDEIAEGLRIRIEYEMRGGEKKKWYEMPSIKAKSDEEFEREVKEKWEVYCAAKKEEEEERKRAWDRKVAAIGKEEKEREKKRIIKWKKVCIALGVAWLVVAGGYLFIVIINKKVEPEFFWLGVVLHVVFWMVVFFGYIVGGKRKRFKTSREIEKEENEDLDF